MWNTKSSYKRKGLFETIDALSKLKERNINFQFNLIGAVGDGLIILKKILKEKNLNKNVKVYINCSLSNKIEILKKTHLYIQPSFSESFGYAVLEASYCNAISLISKNTAMSEIISKYGIYTKKIDSNSIFEGIKFYYNLDKNKENLLLTGLRKHIKKNYSFSKHEKEFGMLLKKLH